MKRIFPVICALICLHCSAQTEEKGDIEQIEAWLSDPGYTKDFRNTFARARLEWANCAEDGSTMHYYVYGFLESDIPKNPEKATLSTLDLKPWQFVKIAPGDNPKQRPGTNLKTLKIADYAKTVLEQEWEVSHHRRKDSVESDSLDTTTYVAVLAVALHLNGEKELAEQLLEKARQLHPKDYRHSKISFRLHLAEEIAKKELIEAENANANNGIDRQQVKEKFERIIQLFPSTDIARRASDFLNALKLSDAVRAQGPFLTDAELEKLPVKEKVAELIRQLETQSGTQFISPGRCDIFNDPRGEKSPAARLEKTGHAAVPQLLDAYSDMRMSRSKSAGFWEGSTLSVAECANAIVERISQKRHASPTIHFFRNDKAGETEKSARAWWDSIQGKSEFDIWAEAVLEGKEDALHRAVEIQRYYGNDKALPVIIEAATKCDEPRIRGTLITLTAKSGLEKAGEFLRNELSTGPFAHTRARAAAALWCLGEKDTATNAMINQWNQRCDAGFPKEPGDSYPLNRNSQIGQAANFLISGQFQSTAGIEAISNRWEELSRPQQNTILNELARHSDFSNPRFDLTGMPAMRKSVPNSKWSSIFGVYPGAYTQVNLQEGGGISGFSIVTSFTKETSPLIDHLLLNELPDTNTVFKSWSSINGLLSYGELAAMRLSKKYPGKYTFEPKSPGKKRDQLRISILNAMLEERQKPPVSLPKWPRQGGEATGQIAHAAIHLDKESAKYPALKKLSDEVNSWPGSKPTADDIAAMTRRAAEALPPGWEFDFRLDEAPAIASGSDIALTIQPFDQTAHNRDIHTMKPGWIWRYYLGKSAGRECPFNYQTQSRVFGDHDAQFDSFDKGLNDFKKNGLNVLKQTADNYYEIRVHLRRAAESRD
ncbi:MAG: hypothetical protein P1V20_30585 [Verrucomicrobiales bacterium]|nr:hypothetical protein [Verrucomicrobiales bacterium]